MNTSLYLSLARAARPLFSLPYPKSWAAFHFLVNRDDRKHHWNDEPVLWTKSKSNGFEIPCDLSVFSGRIAWYFRHWYELATESVIQSLLPKGGTFIDIGGNVGMATLAARKAVGPDGRIFAFEPNPQVADIFAASIAYNGLDNVTLTRKAVGPETRRADFFVPDENHGEAQIGDPQTDRPGKRFQVDVTDTSMLEELDHIDLIKIDVEGFEYSVLQALETIMQKQRPIVVCELMGEHLKRSDTTPQAVLELVQNRGYWALRIETANASLTRQKAKLLPLEKAADDISCNALFVPSEAVEGVMKQDFIALPK